MNFDLTSEQDHLRRTVHEFAEAEIKSHVREWNERQQVPQELTRKLRRLGVFGTIFPEALGDAGMGHVDHTIVVEELARVDPSVALIVAAHTSLCASHIYLHGSEEQRRKYIPNLAAGEWLGCWYLNEPEACSDAAGTRTAAVEDQGHWVRDGSTTFTTNSHQADVCVAMAVTDPAAA